MKWRRIARKIDRFCSWGIWILGVGASAGLDIHNWLGH